MRNSHSIWLTSIIALTVLAFFVVFKPITISPRKDPTDATKYLRTATADSKFSPTSVPKELFELGKVKFFLYVPQHDLRLGLDLRGGMRVAIKISNRADFTYELKKGITGTDEVSSYQVKLIAALAEPSRLGTDARDSKKVRVVISEAVLGDKNNTSLITITTQPDSAEVATAQLRQINDAIKAVFVGQEYTEPKTSDIIKSDRNASIFKQASEQEQTSVTQIMENRLNGTGLAEVTAYKQGSDQVVLEIPGVKDPERVMQMLGKPGLMQFKLVPKSIQVSTDKNTGKTTVFSATNPNMTVEEAIAASTLILEGKDLLPNSTVTSDPQNPQGYAVSFTFGNDRAKDIFANTTRAHVKEQLAIVLDDTVITAPVIQTPITGGSGEITGSFTGDEARDLSVLLNAGALPVPIKVVENRLVSATLGADSVQRSLFAGLIGLALVLIFMFAYYRLPGLMANLALIVYIFLSLAVLRFFNATLTLPGIAGFIIAIGMAVDANVIIFERLKEELRMGKPLESAIDIAFARAWTAILDSNVASLITGMVLWSFGTGAVKGFAVTLVIGVAVSLFTAVSVTRLFMKLMVHSKSGHNLSWYGL